jgi:hypothetical protein
MRGSEFCRSHQPRQILPGDAQNLPSESFYIQFFTEGELLDLAQTVANPSLADEIGILKVLIRRVIARKENPEEALKLVGKAVDQLTRAWRVQRAISGEAADGLASAMAQVLDELSTELGMKL